ncbi:hypothetical protein Arnit_0255 [Arcobacter nitrofigilis DSM 7299]|uniref:Uncharacterized protein n=1 Tax=Arcobacter nitrofigilis (strain ATCC 33309 / DSM 7299 / CCUG 15893 / LMG 7604 / NCTC 12251 / CI) TaxID=572480 RepID=D5V4V9_ARCNC|nr:hypothetical protein [Arcobacter nitrofigilis]ADG91921.1 hypothetical protein Arnit_0255 [Arcobacter nitrofigilis DSM 7299]
MLNKILTIIFIMLSSVILVNAKDQKNSIDLNNIKLVNPKIEPKLKTKKDYQKKEDLLTKPINKEVDLTQKNKDDIEIDGTVNVNTEERSIDGVKINLGKNF